MRSMMRLWNVGNWRSPSYWRRVGMPPVRPFTAVRPTSVIRPKQALQQPLDWQPTQKLCSMGKDATELSNLEAKVIKSLEFSLSFLL